MDSANETCNITILNEPMRIYRREHIKGSRFIRVWYTQNLCIGSYLEEIISLPKKPPKPPKDFPVAKIFARRIVDRK